MKRQAAALSLLGGIALLALTSCQPADDQADATSQVEQNSDSTQSAATILTNQRINIPDVTEPVQLHDGTGEFQIAPGSSNGRVTLIDGTQRTWQSPNRNDLITAMAINNGGSGTFSYIAVYSSKDGSVELEDSAFLGDRIKITNVGIGELVHDKQADYRITIQMLERADGEPMSSEPKIPSTRVFYVTNGKLEAADPAKNDT